MNWEISELKYNARMILKSNYWRTVLVAFILAFVTEGIGLNLRVNTSGRLSEDDLNYIEDKLNTITGTDIYDYYDFDFFNMSSKQEYKASEMTFFDDLEKVTVFSTILIIAGIFLLILTVFGGVIAYLVFKPIEVGCKSYMVKADTGEGTVDDSIAYFKNGIWGRTCLVMFLRSMYIGLWSLLLIIPGIVKAYEYRMIPYIVADHPDWTKEEIFQMSKMMMDGNKWKTFVLDLSFIGWRLLAILTLGVLNILYVNPYSYLTNAQLYIVLKMEYDS